MTNDLRGGLAEQQSLYVLNTLVVDALFGDPLPNLGRAIKDVLVAQARRRVDAVDDDVGSVALDKPSQMILLVGGLKVIVESRQKSAP